MDQTTEQKKVKRTFTGIVVSDKMKQTIVVRIDRMVTHPKYRKRYVRSEKFHVHDEAESYHTGDRVTFQECRPLSKTKRWRVVNPVI